MVISLKLYVGFFDSVSFLLNVVFLFKKTMDSLTLKYHKYHKSFQNQNDRKAKNSFAPRPLIFKLQEQVWKFNDIYVNWSSPKTDPETNIINLENQRVWSTPLFFISIV